MKKLLVIDEDPGILSTLKDLLVEEGYDAMATNHSQQALHLIEHFHFDMVIADFNFPDMEGVSLFLEIRRIYTEMPVIVMCSGGLMHEEITRICAREWGARAIFSKPFKNEALLEKVNKIFKIKITENGYKS